MDERHLEPVDRFAWERLVRTTDTASTVKLVALTLATYGDRHGRNLRPGVARLAVSCGLSERATRGALSTLRDLGLIERTVIGSSNGRRAITDEHRLTQPSPSGTPAGGAGDPWDKPSGSPAPHSGDRPGTPAPRSGTPATDDRTPASDDTNTGTWCTPSDLDQVMTKSSSEAGVRTVGDWLAVASPDDELVSKIAEEQGWPIDHARRVVADVVAGLSEPPRSPLAYVRKCIANESERFRPQIARNGALITPHYYDTDDDAPGDCKCGLPSGNRAHIPDPRYAWTRQ